jgi:catechol 2,3-dioxygenase-like lactoylglutathione lyase family enzyme
MPTSTEQPRWRGVNHLALITADMDATVRFYHGVLGMPLVATIGTPDFRHYFFEIGEKVASFAKPAGVPDPRAIQFDHLSFDLPDEAALESLQARLKEYGCEVTDVIDHGFIRSVYFTDPNGIALEASWWTQDATAGEADYSNGPTFADATPVPAVQELAERGELASMPTTSLVHDATDIADPA